MERFRFMRALLIIALLTLAGCGFAAAQQTTPPPYVYTPPPEPPPPQQPAPEQAPAVPRAPVVGIPFGGLYNTLSGAQPSRKTPPPLTPFNAAP
jgi:glucose/arabinose dehydrogenase